nr:DUF523 and DUF1722 domain-containing protein [uncultured Methanolobus sp.]
MEQFPRPVLLVSRCLEFDKVRYNGQKVSSPIVHDLKQFADMKIVCPEVEVGLGVPRESLRIVKKNDEYRLVQPGTGLDLTDRMNAFSENFLDDLGEVDGFIFKGLSPSMGLGNVKVYAKNEMSPVIERSAGFFAGHVVSRYQGYPMEESERLLNPCIRHHFLTHLYAYAGFRQLKKEISRESLMDYHRNNRFLFMSLNESVFDSMSRLIAGRKEIGRMVAEYEAFLEILLRKPGSEAMKIETARAVFSMLEGLDSRESSFFEDMLGRYAANRISWDAIIAMLRMFAFRQMGEGSYHDRFLYPYPEELKAPADEYRDKDYWDKNYWD